MISIFLRRLERIVRMGRVCCLSFLYVFIIIIIIMASIFLTRMEYDVRRKKREKKRKSDDISYCISASGGLKLQCSSYPARRCPKKKNTDNISQHTSPSGGSQMQCNGNPVSIPEYYRLGWAKIAVSVSRPA